MSHAVISRCFKDSTAQIYTNVTEHRENFNYFSDYPGSESEAPAAWQLTRLGLPLPLSSLPGNTAPNKQGGERGGYGL